MQTKYPDVIVNIVDATNLRRSLSFTTQLLELEIPVVALDKSDLNAKKGTKVDAGILSEQLGCPVVGTVSTTGDGLEEVVKTAVSLRHKGQRRPIARGKWILPTGVLWKQRTQALF